MSGLGRNEFVSHVCLKAYEVGMSGSRLYSITASFIVRFALPVSVSAIAVK